MYTHSKYGIVFIACRVHQTVLLAKENTWTSNLTSFQKPPLEPPQCGWVRSSIRIKVEGTKKIHIVKFVSFLYRCHPF